MDSFLFSLNATLPVFLVILLGFFLNRINILNDAFCKAANQYVFSCALPVSLFMSIAEMDFSSDFDPVFCLFCMLTSTVMFFGTWGISWLLLKDKGQVGAFTQACARSSAAVLGVAFATTIYGDSGMVPMMVMASVPLFNIYTVVILSFSPHTDAANHWLSKADRRDAVKTACVNIAKNPMILGILLGVPFSMLQIPIPTILDNTLSSVGSTATPIALLVVGATFSGKEAMTRWKTALCVSFVKLFLLPAITLPVAALLGFRGSEMVAILLMVGSPTTVASFVMAKNMHADSVLTSNAIVLSTVLSSISITLWLYLLRCYTLI